MDSEASQRPPSGARRGGHMHFYGVKVIVGLFEVGFRRGNLRRRRGVPRSPRGTKLSCGVGESTIFIKN